MSINQAPDRKMAVLLHADVVGSTALVQLHESTAHTRITGVFERLSSEITRYGGTVHELRGDALIAEFPRASDALCAALEFQIANQATNQHYKDDIRPQVRVGIALGEVVIADRTITGPGIVLAQRIEQLAEADGVCVSAAIREAVPSRLPIAFYSLGDHTLKGFDDPVRVWRACVAEGETLPPFDTPPVSQSKSGRRWLARTALAAVLLLAAGLLLWFEPWVPRVEAARTENMALPLPEKPSIAVLPFDNLSGDPDMDYFADGMVESLIGSLASSPDILVIGRKSVMALKGKPTSVREAAERFGVRYILEGSLQGTHARLRVSTRLIDAIRGRQLWSEQFDNDVSDTAQVLDIQDAISRQVAVELDLNLTTGEAVKEAWADLGNFESYRQWNRSRVLYQTFDPRNHEELLRFRRALLKRHPDSVTPYVEMAWMPIRELLMGTASDPAASIKEALRWATRAVAMDARSPSAQIVMATALLHALRHEDAMRHADRALQLTSSAHDATALAGWIKGSSGHREEAVELLRAAMRHEPDHAHWVPIALQYQLTALGRYEESKAVSETLLATKVEDKRAHRDSWLNLAVIAQWQDEPDKARKYIQNLLKIAPEWSGSAMRAVLYYDRDQEYVKRWVQAAVAAGLPDGKPTNTMTQ